MALKEKGDLPGALKKVNEAVDLLPTAPEPRAARAFILMALERYKDALDDWSFAKTKMEPDDPNAYRVHLFIGQCRWRLGDNAGAEGDALEAKRLTPKSTSPKELEMIEDLLDASTLAQAFGGPDDAAAKKKSQEDSLVVDGDKTTGSIEAFHKKQSELMDEARILQKNGDLPAALKKATEAVDLLPLTLDPHYRRAEILMDLKRYKDALVDWSYLVENLEEGDEQAYIFRFQRADCRLLLGDKAGARADALEAQRLSPKSIKPEERTNIEEVLRLSALSGGPVAPTPGEKSAANPGEAALNYFAWGKEICALGRYSYHQKIAPEKEAPIARQRALLEKLQLGPEVLANFDALAKLIRGESLPAGNYTSWTKRDQQRWDKEFLPAAAALGNASNRLSARDPEIDYFYLLGFETYALSVALPENVRNRGPSNAVTRAELQKGLNAFVWLRENMPPNRLSAEVAASVNGLANYKAGLSTSAKESPPPAEMDKIVALATAISNANEAGKLLR